MFQAGIDRYNLSTVDPNHVIREWELKHLPFSLANGEIGVNGKVNRSVIVSKYTSQIERMFNTQVRSLVSVNIVIRALLSVHNQKTESRIDLY